ncbi:MAG: hypothetical protein HOP02_01235 [Methylococcaceae bacterium]|nr:hypothetical protein [Methylococcaceae bacterium]
MTQYLLVYAICLLATIQAHAEHAETVVQQNQITPKSATTASAFLATGKQPFTLNLPELKIDLSPTTTGMHKTGVVYHLPTPIMASHLFWERVNGGHVARIKLTSHQAKALRYHLVFNQEVPSIKFRIQDSQGNAPLILLDHTFIHDNHIWLPAIEGNQADLELFLDELTALDSLFSIDAINVIVADLSNDPTLGIHAKKLGRAENPEKDLACWSGDPNYSALEKAASATALISFIKSGLSYVCTGTLLNDKNDTKIPWFTTANHCLTDQNTANTASFQWFYQAKTCNSNANDDRFVTTNGGAQLLWSDSWYDGAFLKLNQPPPNGATFMGWDTNIQINDEVWGVHHPKADHTMVSRGRITALLQNISVSGTPFLVNTINFDEGGGEQGSSGSGLFAIQNGSAYWKGSASGISLFNYQKAAYSDFNSYYPMIKQWLGEGDYQSTYQNISWVTHSDTEYCLDITDEKWVIYPGFQALQCGKNFGQFSPTNYVRDVMLTSLPNGFKFNWRVWSRNAQGKTTYGGAGYEGRLTVPE